MAPYERTDESDAPARQEPWVETYLEARRREGRLYPDSLVAHLPIVPRSHPLHDEWRRRADSSARLVEYLRRRRPAFVLDAGCGNGWLTNLMAGIPGVLVHGIDPNEVELDQAARVFRAPNLRFTLDDILGMTPREPPDVVILASVIQYIPDLGSALQRIAAMLAPGGETHILDSPLYEGWQLEDARERTRRHYASVGVPRMADAYHHHTWEVLDGFRADVLYLPRAGLRARVERRVLGRPRSPFPWIRIRAT